MEYWSGVVPWLMEAMVGSVMVTTISARPAQTAWIYLKTEDGRVERKIPSQVPMGAAVQSVNTSLVSRNGRGTMQTLVASVPFVPIVTLPPHAFSELPRSTLQQLEETGCRVPQLSPPQEGLPKHVNVIQGEFARPGQEDWAVLCATGPKVRVHILWSRPSNCPSDFASSVVPELDGKTFAESLSLDDILSGHVGSGEWLGVILPIDRAKLMGYPPPPPPPMDH
ncbi:MAG TPA: hypothetical protein VI455_12370 [Terriglobia bacterium]